MDFELTLVNLLNAIDSVWGVIRFATNAAIPILNSGGYVAAGQVGTTLGGRIVTQDDIGKPILAFSERTVNDAPDQRPLRDVRPGLALAAPLRPPLLVLKTPTGGGGPVRPASAPSF